MQSRNPLGSGAAGAIATNIPLQPGEDLEGTLDASLLSLPPHGILLYATFSARGDPSEDPEFKPRALPLRIAGTEPERFNSGERLFQAGVGGYNVRVHIYYGAEQVSARMRQAAQRQLSGLFIASERVTMVARPSTLPAFQHTTLFGSVDSRKAGEQVTIQAKDCGSPDFRVVAGSTTRDGGGWSTEYDPGLNTTLRAVWDGNASAAVTIRVRAGVYLRRLAPNAFRIVVWRGRSSLFSPRYALFQRQDRRLGTWMPVKQVALDRASVVGTDFKASVPKGSLVRVVVPSTQARPCYLAGVTSTLRT